MMDDNENDLDGLFEEYENGNEENADNINTGNANQSEPTENAEKVVAPRRAVRNPRLKFNADRLCGDRGIPVVVKHFEGVKFKGKGHEVEDLNKLLSTLEHWCHRLYPSMKFEDCLRQIEKLGKKRPVQTCLRKIRLDMPILNDDFIHDEPEDNEDPVDVEIPPQDAFDRLIGEIQGNSNAPLASTPLPVKTSAPEQRLGSFGSTLSEEQRKRMEYNKMLATERRKAKFLAMQSSTVPSNEREDLFTVESTSITHNSAKRKATNSISEDIFTQSTSLLSPKSSTVPSNESEDLFTVESTSVAHNSAKRKATNSISEDIFTESTSLLSPKSDKMHSASNNYSEELELDDLVNLVDEDDEPSVITNEENCSSISSEMNVQVHGQNNFIDLIDDGGSKGEKNYTEVVDLEKEVAGSFIQNKIIEVINLDDKTGSIEPITVVNLDPEVNNSTGVITLENEEFVDLTNEKITDDSNSDIELINAPSIFSTDFQKGDLDASTLDQASSESQNACETLQDDVEFMEVE